METGHVTREAVRLADSSKPPTRSEARHLQYIHAPWTGMGILQLLKEQHVNVLLGIKLPHKCLYRQ